MVKTLESKKRIEIGMEIRFAELWGGDGDGQELLEGGHCCLGRGSGNRR